MSDIFSRIEADGRTTVSEIKDWLSGGYRGNRKRPESSYINAANQFAEPFGVRQDVKDAEDYDDVDNVSKSSKLMVVKDKNTLDQVKELVANAKESKKNRRRCC